MALNESGFSYDTSVPSGTTQYTPLEKKEVTYSDYLASIGKKDTGWNRFFGGLIEAGAPYSYQTYKQYWNDLYDRAETAHYNNYLSQYNSDAGRMARAEEAGLNPYYLSGAGASSAGQSDAYHSTQTTAEQRDGFGFIGGTLQTALGLAQEVMKLRSMALGNEATQAAIGKTNAETNLINQTTPWKVSGLQENFTSRWLNNARNRWYLYGNQGNVGDLQVLGATPGSYFGIDVSSPFASDITARRANIIAGTRLSNASAGVKEYDLSDILPLVKKFQNNLNELQKMPIKMQDELMTRWNDVVVPAVIEGMKYKAAADKWMREHIASDWWFNKATSAIDSGVDVLNSIMGARKGNQYGKNGQMKWQYPVSY